MVKKSVARQCELTVVIPVLNGAETIGTTLSSLEAQQTSAAWEMVVADNGSTDSTRALVHDRAVRCSVPLRIVDASKSRGAAFARNVGVLAAAGNEIAFCDADDAVRNDWVETAHRALQHADVVGGPIRELRTPFDPNAPVVRYSVARSIKSDAPMVTGTGNIAIRKDVFMRVGGIDVSMRAYGGEDNEFAVRLVRAGVRPIIDEDLVYYFRSASDLRTSLSKVLSASRAEVAIWKKHPDYFAEENRPSRNVRAVADLPFTVLRQLRERNVRGAARSVVRLVGNLDGRFRTARTVPAPLLIDSMSVPREITLED